MFNQKGVEIVTRKNHFFYLPYPLRSDQSANLVVASEFLYFGSPDAGSWLISLILTMMDLLEEKWGKQYPTVITSWRNNWERLSNYFKYPEPIRRLVYTTNTVEGYHRMVRKVTKSKGAFTSEMAALKLIYMTTINFEKK